MPRSHHAQIDLPVSADEAFAALITPSAIRGWWSASRAIVIPEEGGLWMASWGEDEDQPEYVSGATILTLRPPNTLVLGDTRYAALGGPLPFQADLPIRFTIEATDKGCTLHIRQSGFPDDPIADEHYAACEVGWRETLASLRDYLTRP